ncbi:helix-turn-helix domain-containing protein [Streptomyces sioyaensis]|uniref:helix-turn-helix domain-containing protein n=1 Tax=Streptomyces sioyaensis TaxID=67364 RepID=UPI0037D07E7E
MREKPHITCTYMGGDMYRLRINALREAAAEHGDRTAYAIARRTGIAESSAYRYLAGESQPDLNSMLRISEAYGTPIESLMERTEEPAGAAA